MTDSNVAQKAGLEGVVAADSAIGRIDGERGELRYRGYLIRDLAEHSDFVETCWLLWHGELPTRAERARLESELASQRRLPDAVHAVLRTVAATQSPMDALRTATSVLSVENGGERPAELAGSQQRAVRLTAVLPTIVAAYERLRHGEEPLAPRDDLGHAANFLWMLRGREPDPEIAAMLDTCLVLHAEHGFNASTFAARVTAATLSDLDSAVVAAIATLKGPLHGGANTAVMQTLLAIGDEAGVEAWLDGALARREKVMGFGHRVYKVVDPRGLILREFSKRLGDLTGEPKWFRMSERLAERMHARKGLDVNVDFWSASTYYAMGIAPDLYTPLFAISRVAGWTAHVLEQYANNRLIRPRAHWVGPGPRDYVSIEKRG